MAGGERRDHPVAVSFFDGVGLFAGRGRKFSVEELAEACTMSERTLRSYHQREAEPGLINFIALAAVLPPSFAGRVLAHAGLRVVPADSAGGTPCDLTTSADVAKLMAGLAEALRDGKIDHVERAALAEEARALGQALLCWADPQGPTRAGSAGGRDLSRADHLGGRPDPERLDRATWSPGNDPPRPERG